MRTAQEPLADAPGASSAKVDFTNAERVINLLLEHPGIQTSCPGALEALESTGPRPIVPIGSSRLISELEAPRDRVREELLEKIESLQESDKCPVALAGLM